MEAPGVRGTVLGRGIEAGERAGARAGRPERRHDGGRAERCGFPRGRRPPPVDAEPAPDGRSSAAALELAEAGGPVAWVAGTPISAGDLLSEWYWIAGRELWLVFDKLVAMQLATVEAQRLGVRMAPESVELRVAEENRRLASEVATLGADVTIEDYLRSRHGFEPDGYFRHLRVATIRQMMAERTVRSWTLSNEWARVRLIVVADDEDLAEVQAGLAAGQEFGSLAREYSLDDTRETGGLVPYLVRQEHSPLARLAFVTPVGEVAGPLEVSGHRALIHVESRNAPRTGTWKDIGQAVEDSLAEHPLTDSEFLHWKLNMEKRYSIDVGPLEAMLRG